MRNATKNDIFQLLTLVLSVTTSVAVLWTPAHFGFGNAETDEILGLLPAFVFIAAFAYVQWARLLNFISRLFEKKNKH